MRRPALLFSLLLSACVGQVSVPGPSAATAPPAAATPTPTASVPSASPTATPRSVRPFDRVAAVAGPGDGSFVAVDRERIAFVEGTTVSVIDVATGQKRGVFQAMPGWGVSLSPRGLRGETLVLLESRTDGQRTDGRAIRIDLRGDIRGTIDEWSGPFLGGGDTWAPEPPVTNGTDVVWVRITDEGRPFAVDVMLSRATAAPRVISTSTSAAWADLHDDGRIAVSTFITRGDRAELVIWRDGQVTAVGTRGSPDGGPARFIGDRLFWGIGPAIAARVERGQLITVGGAVQDVAFPGCAWTGATARHLAIGCGTGAGSSFTLLDPVSGVRGDAIAAFQLVAGPRAALWREGSQWWLGILPP